MPRHGRAGDLARRRHAPPAHRRRRRDRGRGRERAARTCPGGHQAQGDERDEQHRRRRRRRRRARRADRRTGPRGRGPVGRRARGARPRGRAGAQRRAGQRRHHRGRRRVHRAHPEPHRRAGQGRRGRHLPDLQHRRQHLLPQRDGDALQLVGPAGGGAAGPHRRRRGREGDPPARRHGQDDSARRAVDGARRQGVGLADLRDVEAGQRLHAFGPVPARRRHQLDLLVRAARRLAALRPLLPRRGGRRVQPGEHRAAGQHRRRRAGAPLRRRLAARADQARTTTCAATS